MRTSSMLTLFVALLAMAQNALTQDAQPSADGTQTPAYTIRTTARLIVLDVVVSDANRNVITGLTRDDFKVVEAGEPQTILNFDTAGALVPPAEMNINSTADLDRLAPRAPVNIIVLDEFSTKFEDRAFARYSLKKFFSTQPDKLDTPTMLLAVDQKNFFVLRDYTQNKHEILSAMDHHLAQTEMAKYASNWAIGTYGVAIATLTRVAQASIGHQGHKNIIWIGRGFPAFSTSEMTLDQENRTNGRVQECVNTLRDARVTLYTVDPQGLPGLPGPTNGLLVDVNGGNFQFNKLAVATGGSALYGRNDVDLEIGRSIRSGSSFYTLSYRPSNDSSDPQKYRKIKVTVDHPGLTIAARSGYYVEQPVARVNLLSPQQKIVADMLLADRSTMVYDAVPVTVSAAAVDPYDLKVKVAPALSVVWSDATDEEARAVDVMVLGSTYDKSGRELTRVVKSYHVNAPRSVTPSGPIQQKLDVAIHLDPHPKAIRARVVVRIGSTARLGTADLTLPAVVSASTK